MASKQKCSQCATLQRIGLGEGADVGALQVQFQTHVQNVTRHDGCRCTIGPPRYAIGAFDTIGPILSVVCGWCQTQFRTLEGGCLFEATADCDATDAVANSVTHVTSCAEGAVANLIHNVT